MSNFLLEITLILLSIVIHLQTTDALPYHKPDCKCKSADIDGLSTMSKVVNIDDTLYLPMKFMGRKETRAIPMPLAGFYNHGVRGDNLYDVESIADEQHVPMRRMVKKRTIPMLLAGLYNHQRKVRKYRNRWNNNQVRSGRNQIPQEQKVYESKGNKQNSMQMNKVKHRTLAIRSFLNIFIRTPTLLLI